MTGADVDALFVGPRYLERKDFFTFFEKLKAQREVKDIRVSLRSASPYTASYYIYHTSQRACFSLVQVTDRIAVFQAIKEAFVPVIELTLGLQSR